MRGLVWFKKDLRTIDQPALSAATERCDEGVIALYIIDKKFWQQHDTSLCQIEFIYRGLTALATDLAALNINLIIKHIEHTQHIPTFIYDIMQQHELDELFFNYEYEINEKRRDEAVVTHLKKFNLKSHAYHDQLILPPDLLIRPDYSAYKVFTPFKKFWLSRYQDANIKCVKPIPCKKLLKLNTKNDKLDSPTSSIQPSLWPAGELAAEKRLTHFIKKNLNHYAEKRDFPFEDATSRLSPYLTLGMISARKVFQKILACNDQELFSGKKSILTFLSELIWREFYRHVLIHTPRVSMHKAYQQKTENLNWQYDEKLLSAWQKGETGFPIVDAGMRQLNQTGFMHNRLRMICAMFLSKNLFLDWRIGEKYFAENLIDFDLASNNGGWQWSASTGTDAVPYFRIFNPTTQSQRFDPTGDFIKLYCPELKSLDAKTIHEPFAKPLFSQRLNYPKPIIDYKQSRERILKAFKSLS